MSRIRARQSTGPIAASPTLDDSDPSVEGIDSEASLEKDETELELEKLVFGDEAGFQEGLSAYKRKSRIIDQEEIEGVQRGDDQLEELGEGIEGVDDADLFFLDSEPSAVAPELSLIQGNTLDDNDDQAGSKCGPAWVDSDDERMVVSLASHSRLRKLRITESEDLINGREYTKRLRRQFERLYPVPDWANPSSMVKPKQRRRSNASDNSGGDDSADDMSIDSDDLSVQPLAKLLQNATDLIKTTSGSSSGRQKLRPEVIDIQRTKDVGLAQPSSITSLTFHPLHPLLLSSGPASTLFLHHISPHPPNSNPLLTSLHLRSTPLHTSTFLPPGGAKIFFSGRRRYFHTWDLSSGKVDKVSHVYGHGNEQRTMERFKLSPCGRWMGLVGSGRKGGGMVNVLDARTCQWVAEVRVEGRGGVADFAWWGNGEGMVILGKGGEAVEWDGQEKRTVGRWMDEGAVGITVVALGGRGGGLKALGGDRWLAVGSSSGIVN
ncbi:hypothetical protein MMC29_008554, partial [Sticta canariensis]|nr:hypothetical protein [Sticta canariensis]